MTWEDKFDKNPVRTGMGLTVVVVIFCLVLIWGITAAVFGLRVATAGIVGAGQAKIQIQSAGFRITAYNHFFDLCSSVQTHEVQIDALRAQLSDTTDERSKNIVRSSLTGVLAARGGAIARYNQDALKEYTEGQFKDADLPYQLATAAYNEQGSNKTKCALQ